MAFNDMFRERVVIEPDRVREICGIRERAEVYELAGLSPEMFEWIDRAGRAGETVVPRQVYEVQLFEQYSHRVGWFYHSIPGDDSVEDFHHIACDCVGEFDAPAEEIGQMLQCPATVAALDHRAQRVHKVMGNRELFHFAGKPEDALALKPHAIITAKAVINFMMNYEQAHPEGWIANVISGEHQISLLSAVLQIVPEKDNEETETLSTREIVEEMHEDGSLMLHDDGETVSLPLAA